jgi:hypothetical protein
VEREVIAVRRIRPRRIKDTSHVQTTSSASSLALTRAHGANRPVVSW